MRKTFDSFTPNEKQEVIREVFGNKVPDYQWYGIPSGAKVNRDEIARLTGAPQTVTMGNGSVHPDYTNIEMHGSRFPSGAGLRVRNAQRVVANLPCDIGNRQELAPLYQAVNDYLMLDKNSAWVDFMEGTLTSRLPEHEAVAEKHGLAFKLCTDETLRAEMKVALA